MTTIEDLPAGLAEGTVIHGTLRSEDLITAFIPVLEVLEPDTAARLKAEAEKYIAEVDDGNEAANETLCEIVIEVQDRIDALLPHGWTFSNTEGDGSDFGIWRTEEDEDEEVEVEETFALWGVSYLLTRQVSEFNAYLYGHTTVVETTQADGIGWGNKPESYSILITETKVHTSVEHANDLQQYQADRLASGLLPMVIGFTSLDQARVYVGERIKENSLRLDVPS